MALKALNRIGKYILYYCRDKIPSALTVIFGTSDNNKSKEQMEDILVLMFVLLNVWRRKMKVSSKPPVPMGDLLQGIIYFVVEG